MSIALTDFLSKVNRLLGDDITGTTTGDGNDGKLTLVDLSLKKYADGYFGDPERNPEWWVYVSSQLRPIKKSTGGTVIVYTAFSAKIVASTDYELHHFDRDKKFEACNQALYDCYPHFYQRMEDETTLTGTGANDNKYEVPATFTEFPDLIFEKYVSGDYIKYIPVIEFDVKEISGIRYFYANITTGEPILLVGKKYLSQFTDDSSTTELSDGQANAVSLLAASIFCRTLSAIVNAEDSGRFDSLTKRFEAEWESKKLQNAMPILFPNKVSHGWLDE